MSLLKATLPACYCILLWWFSVQCASWEIVSSFFFLSHLLVIYSYWRIKYTALKFVSENWKEKGTLGGDPNILSSGFVNFVSSAILHIKNVFAILRPFNQSHKVYSPFAPSKKKSFQNEKKVRIKISFVQSELQFLKKTVYFMSACHTSYCH